MAAITPFLERTVRTEGSGTAGDAEPSTTIEPPGGPVPTIGDLLSSPCLGGDCGSSPLAGTDDYGADDESIVVTSGAGAPKLSDLAAPPQQDRKAKDLLALHKLSDRVERDPMGMKGYLQDALGKTCRTHQECQALALEYFELEVQSFRETYGEEPDLTAAARPMGDFGAVRDVPELASSHAELTRTVWIRRSLEEALLTGGPGGGPRDFWVESDKTGELFFHVHPLIEADEIPWYKGIKVPRYSFFGSNGKMACPTWDLPAGAPSIGGSCPGATAAQSAVEPRIRGGQLQKQEGRLYLAVQPPGATTPMELNERTAICQQCYATGGNYPSPHVQTGEILRYWWSRSMMEEDKVEEWIETMVRAVGALNIPRTRDGIRPIRIHSAGDFFSPKYAAAWIEVANRVWDLEVELGRTHPEIRFWAPTRTWAARGWDWNKLADGLNQPNLIVRPSSYHVDDPAPEAVAEGWPRGATTIINDHNRGMRPEVSAPLKGIFKAVEAARAGVRGSAGYDDRFDWTCQTYATHGNSDLAPSCADAAGPDGKQGCRACWTRPDLRINYTTH